MMFTNKASLSNRDQKNLNPPDYKCVMFTNKASLNNRCVKPRTAKKNNRGALMVEYALLIVVCIILAGLFLKTVEVDAENGPAQSGFIIQKWWGVLKTVAEDT